LRFVLELFDVEPVGASVEPPVDAAQVVAELIVPVLGKLDTEALERAPVKARQEAVHHEAGSQLEAGQVPQQRQVQRRHR